jgi:hypothetical protein
MENKFFFFPPSVLIKTPIDIPGNGTQAFSMGRARTFMTTATDMKASGKTGRYMVMALTPAQMEPSGLDTLGTAISREKREKILLPRQIKS